MGKHGGKKSARDQEHDEAKPLDVDHVLNATPGMGTGH